MKVFPEFLCGNFPHLVMMLKMELKIHLLLVSDKQHQ